MTNSTNTATTAVVKQHPDRSFSAQLQPLYSLALGEDWRNLDAELRCFHCVTTPRHASGVFSVQRGSNWLARLVASIFRLPAEGPDVPITLAIHCELKPKASRGPVEVWDRTFGNRRLISRQWLNSAGRLVERYGLVEVYFMLGVETGALCIESAGAAIALGPLRVKMPHWLAPRIEARVTCERSPASRLAVSVRFLHPIVGLFLSYEGHIAPTDTQS